MTGNRKILGARMHVLDGISFRSKLEMEMYLFLRSRGVEDFSHEGERIVLVDGFRPKALSLISGSHDTKKVRDITYTPDFTFTWCGRKVYLEAKGFPNDRYPLKRTLFRRWMEENDPDAVFVEAHSVGELSASLGIMEVV